MNHTANNPLWNVQIAHMQVTGGAHHQCQDVIFSTECQSLVMAGIADGKSDARYGSQGGYAALRSLAEYIIATGPESFFQAPFPDALPCTLAAVFRSQLQELAQASGAPYPEFASTLLLLVIDRSCGRYFTAHLGNGCAIGVSHTGALSVLSPPEHGLTIYHTWLTTSDNAIAHLRLSFGQLEDKKRILLLSNGADCFCRNGHIPARAQEALRAAPSSALRQRLTQSMPVDDASCILLEISREKGEKSR